jgi:hypothetical protein
MDRPTEHPGPRGVTGPTGRTIAASRIQPHGAGPVALQAVEHTDPDAVVGGPVRGGAAGYPHARLQVEGQLPVAGAFVAPVSTACAAMAVVVVTWTAPIRCSADGYARVPQGRAKVEPVRVAAGAYHGPLGQVDQEGPATG